MRTYCTEKRRTHNSLHSEIIRPSSNKHVHGVHVLKTLRTVPHEKRFLVYLIVLSHSVPHSYGRCKVLPLNMLRESQAWHSCSIPWPIVCMTTPSHVHYCQTRHSQIRQQTKYVHFHCFHVAGLVQGISHDAINAKCNQSAPLRFNWTLNPSMPCSNVERLSEWQWNIVARTNHAAHNAARIVLRRT